MHRYAALIAGGEGDDAWDEEIVVEAGSMALAVQWASQSEPVLQRGGEIISIERVNWSEWMGAN